ncbi:MAG: SH3 domain-containing protein [Saprospiraceae bacterium]
MKHIFILLISFCLFHSAFAQDRKFPPRNEVNTDPSLTAFVASLQKALAVRDTSWIISRLDRDETGAFGREDDLRSFIKEWDMKNDSGEFWKAMTKVIGMGGVFLHDTADETGKYQFVFPYSYAIDLGIEDDPYYIGLITGHNVNLRKDANTNSPVVKQLDYNVVRFISNKKGELITRSDKAGNIEWYNIQAMDKSKKGWVNSKFIYSLMGPRLFLYRDKNDKWKISEFVTGD